MYRQRCTEKIVWAFSLAPATTNKHTNTSTRSRASMNKSLAPARANQHTDMTTRSSSRREHCVMSDGKRIVAVSPRSSCRRCCSAYYITEQHLRQLAINGFLHIICVISSVWSGSRRSAASVGTKRSPPASKPGWENEFAIAGVSYSRIFWLDGGARRWHRRAWRTSAPLPPPNLESKQQGPGDDAVLIRNAYKRALGASASLLLAASSAAADGSHQQQHRPSLTTHESLRAARNPFSTGAAF